MERNYECPKCGQDRWSPRSDQPGKFRCLECKRVLVERRRDRLVAQGLTRSGAERIDNDPIVRFERRYDVDLETGCWIFSARYFGKLVDNPKSTTSQYGTFWDGTRNVLAHRYSYELHVGPIPEGLDWTIDHLCETKKCVNPEHLELVSRSENSLRRASRHRERNLLPIQ